jgi:hypothetical protein
MTQSAYGCRMSDRLVVSLGILAIGLGLAVVLWLVIEAVK